MLLVAGFPELMRQWIWAEDFKIPYLNKSHHINFV